MYDDLRRCWPILAFAISIAIAHLAEYLLQKPSIPSISSIPPGATNGLPNLQEIYMSFHCAITAGMQTLEIRMLKAARDRYRRLALMMSFETNSAASVEWSQKQRSAIILMEVRWELWAKREIGRRAEEAYQSYLTDSGCPW